MRVSSWNRTAPNTFPAAAKATANYANSTLIKMEAMLDGYAEGIALDTLGYVSEGSGQNLFIVRQERDLHAAGPLVDPGRHHARLDHDDRARPRLRRARGGAAARDALSRRRGVLLRHGRRGDADPLDRQDRDRHAAGGRSPRPSGGRSSTSSTASCPIPTGWLTFVYEDEAQLREGIAPPPRERGPGVSPPVGRGSAASALPTPPFRDAGAQPCLQRNPTHLQ